MASDEPVMAEGVCARPVVRTTAPSGPQPVGRPADESAPVLPVRARSSGLVGRRVLAVVLVAVAAACLVGAFRDSAASFAAAGLRPVGAAGLTLVVPDAPEASSGPDGLSVPGGLLDDLVPGEVRHVLVQVVNDTGSRVVLSSQVAWVPTGTAEPFVLPPEVRLQGLPTSLDAGQSASVDVTVLVPDEWDTDDEGRASGLLVRVTGAAAPDPVG